MHTSHWIWARTRQLKRALKHLHKHIFQSVQNIFMCYMLKIFLGSIILNPPNKFVRVHSMFHLLLASFFSFIQCEQNYYTRASVFAVVACLMLCVVHTQGSNRTHTTQAHIAVIDVYLKKSREYIK